jgi:hypothetical protein
MRVIIRRANLQEDRLRLIAFFHEFLTPNSDERRFDWLYQQCPHGVASAWMAINQEDSQLVGAAAAFPRRINSAGKEIQGYVLGDFCIHPRFRSLGPAVQLQRACLEEIAAKSGAICFDFPSDSMVAIYRRLGATPQERLLRLAKPLRANRVIASKIKSRRVAGGLATVANLALNSRDAFRGSNRAEQISRHEGPLGEEFSKLAEEACHEDEICVAQTAAYLNWRYRAHPFAKFEILTARRAGQLLGCLIYAKEGDDARIVGLLSASGSDLTRNLVLQCVKFLREQGVMTIHAAILASHSYVRLFRSLGFLSRESCPVVIYPSSGGQSEGNNGKLRQWFLMDGDRDS